MRTRANALVWNSSAVQSALAQISARHIPSVLGGPLFTVVALGYALWRRRPALACGACVHGRAEPMPRGA
jgi:hypothetical protein